MIDVVSAASELDAAAIARVPLGRPFSDDEAFGEDTAYEIQRAVVAHRVGRGARIVGSKLGLTSRAKQRQMGVAEPLHGRLTTDMVVDGAEPIDLDAYIHVRAEPEIGFVIGREVHAPATVTSVLAATEYLFAALELIDSRYDDFRFRHADVIADNASSAGFVMGSVTRAPGAIGDLRLLGAVLRRDGAVVATAAGAAALGHPAQAVAWLVDDLARRGESLEPGSIVLSGALTDAIELAAGTVVTADIAELGTAQVFA